MRPALLSILICDLILALCDAPPAIGQLQPPGEDGNLTWQGVPPARGGLGFGVDHSFKGSDGAIPTAAVIQDAGGNLYGTTSSGGNTGCGGAGCGVVFKLSPGNRETVLHRFAGAPSDGAAPTGRLVMDDAGNLYGTTSAGGSSSLGTVFKIDVSGTETMLHSFAGGNDGASPYAGLVMDGAGNLYGTTEAGGRANVGTIYKIDSSGNESVLYSFAGGSSDGADPKAGLTLDSSGDLYGTTFSGGASGVGTVFELSASGTETVLYNFTGAADGANPFGGVIRDSNGVLYGTAENGGSSHVYGMERLQPEIPHGCCRGIVYSLVGNTQNVLYTFTGGNDGGNPACDLVLSGGVLYGTSLSGGPGHRGTAFSLTVASRSESVLHGFTGRADGGTPQAGLLMNGTGVLYGTATGGGRNNVGTVFQYKRK